MFSKEVDKNEANAKGGSAKVIGAILAAGASTRFGTPKQIATISGKALIDSAIETLIESNVHEVCVVLGCGFENINNHLTTHMASSNKTFTVLNNEDWEEGLSSSIRTATKFAMACEATELLLMVCDQPFVTSELINQLLETAKRSHDQSNSESVPEQASSSIIACKYANTVGIPVIFPEHYFAKLQALRGDRGAKSVILESTDPIYVDFAKGDVDIDVPSDMELTI